VYTVGRALPKTAAERIEASCQVTIEKRVLPFTYFWNKTALKYCVEVFALKAPWQHDFVSPHLGREPKEQICCCLYHTHSFAFRDDGGMLLLQKLGPQVSLGSFLLMGHVKSVAPANNVRRRSSFSLVCCVENLLIISQIAKPHAERGCRRKSMQTVCIDNGAYRLKAGFAGDAEPTCIVPNFTAQMKAQLQQLVADETMTKVNDISQLTFTSSLDRGYVVNWDCQRAVINRVCNEKLRVQPRNCNLLITEAPFTMDNIHSSLDEMVFEELGFAGYSRMPSAHLCALAYEQQQPKSDFALSCAKLVLDCGHSFTHAIPVLNGVVLRNGVRRLNIGGKFLTNLLKETVSYRQWNMMDDTHIISHVKEVLCYCSMDFNAEMKKAERNRGAGLREAYVLPDYQNTMVGHVKVIPSAADIAKKKAAAAVAKAGGGKGVLPATPQVEEQLLMMQNERVTVPELLFHPSDVGINQMGIPEMICDSVMACPPSIRGLLMSSILVVGGSSKFPNFHKRLETELRACAPADYEIGLHSCAAGAEGAGTDASMSEAEDGPAPPSPLDVDPSLCAWRGASAYAASAQFRDRLVTKAEYEERGHSICRERLDLW
jgi:actin-related protein 6